MPSDQAIGQYDPWKLISYQEVTRNNSGLGIMPENAETSLQVSTPPLADTAGYDGLRAQDITEEIGHA